MADMDGVDAPTVWVIRAGRPGEERDDFYLDHGLVGVGWGQLPDLTSVGSREDIAKLIRADRPNARNRSVGVRAGYLWRFRTEVRVGDVVVLPLTTTSQLALGVVTREYWYRENADPGKRHVVSVDWKRTEVPRTTLHPDLKDSLSGARSAVSAVRRKDRAWRFYQLMLEGRDPGIQLGQDGEAGGSDGAVDNEVADDAESEIDLESVGVARIQDYIAERFPRHRLSDLVAAVLEAEGFKTDVSPPGPDGGVDVFAGRGPLGLDRPHLIAQVKSSTSSANVTVVRELNGVLTDQDADQGLLVAWGGVTRDARREIRQKFFRIRLWNAEDLVEAVLRNYDKLDQEIQAELPLKQVWTLIED